MHPLKGLWPGSIASLVTVVVAASALAGPTEPARLAERGRTVADMPDGASGPQVHILYVIPQDGEDRSLDTTSAISRSVSSSLAWLLRQTGNRVLRVDTYQGDFDITFFRLSSSNAAVAARGQYVREQLEEELYAAGFNSPTKMYFVYYDGSSTSSCGGGDPEPTVRGNFSALYLKGTPPGAPPCASNALGLDPPGYLEFGFLHELVHSLGFVPRCAPHARGDFDAGHVSDSRYDLMWAGPQPWGTNEPQRMQLDVGRDDYYMANVPGCPDLSSSPYLATVHSVSVTVNGPGAVTSSPPGIACPGACTASFEGAVTLSAAANPGAIFTGWDGACTGTSTCVLPSGGSVSAVFANPRHRRSLTLRITGNRATGAIGVADNYAACRARMVVNVERRGKHGWSLVGRARTNAAGQFSVSIPRRRASYRARAPEVAVAGHRCSGAVSRTVASG